MTKKTEAALFETLKTMELNIKTLALFAAETHARVDTMRVVVAAAIDADVEQWKRQEENLMDPSRQRGLDEMLEMRKRIEGETEWGKAIFV